MLSLNKFGVVSIKNVAGASDGTTGSKRTVNRNLK
jgi:hypothetical protein